MNDLVLAVIIAAIVVAVIISQVKGSTLSWKRLVILPAVLAAFGVANLAGMAVRPIDVACIAVSAAVAAVIGLGQGVTMHLESRGGALWGRLPVRGLWWWAALIVSRVAVMAVAVSLHAKAAASADSVFLVLGINRLAQAAMIGLRASRAGLPLSAPSWTAFTDAR
ncbi:MAG TPA: hypothetical protein VMH35_18195 [Streptosporangiaceae bacterium]|nr:hypothetical protein [Streptosporangiaceae bacterium]